jgi:hypothetical protein
MSVGCDGDIGMGIGGSGYVEGRVLLRIGRRRGNGEFWDKGKGVEGRRCCCEKDASFS